MTRTQLLQEVYRDFGYADTPASAVSTRILQYLNDRHRRLTMLPGVDLYRTQTFQLALVASQAEYTLAMPIQRLLAVVDTTNNRRLMEQSLTWYRTVDPSPSTGTQEYWIPMRWGPALRDISTTTGSGVWVVSTSAADNTQTAETELIDVNGSLRVQSTALNGTTRVQVGTATNYMRVQRFAIDAAGAGVISLYDAAAAGNEVSRINLSRTSAQLLTIALWPTPAAADNVRLDYVQWIYDFNATYNEPVLPADFHYLVALGAKIDEGRRKGPEFASKVVGWQQEYFQGIRELYAFTHPHGVMVPGSVLTAGRSNLGSAYPPGIW